MVKDYKESLKAHVAKVPPMPGAIISGSPPFTKALVPDIKAKKFKAVNNQLFTDYTGLTHQGLVENWADGGQLTSCNSFLAGCCGAMGIPNLGAFELENLLKKQGKSHAWVKGLPGARPQYGDIWTAFGRLHMGLSLGFAEDGDWLTIEGGQGGSIAGADIIKRKKGPFKEVDIEGWCDVRAWLDPLGGVPDWLPGWWVIYHGEETYHYHFNRYHEVTYEQYRRGDSSAPSNPTDRGKYKLGPGESVVVTWNTEMGTENFTYDRWNSVPAINERMTGTGAKGEALRGVRM